MFTLTADSAWRLPHAPRWIAIFLSIVVGFFTTPLRGLEIVLTYDTNDSDPPSMDPGGDQLQAMMQAAVNAWEEMIRDDWTLDLAFTWSDLDDDGGTLGVELTLNTSDGKPTRAQVRFDTQVGSAERNWYIDPTPTDHSEYDLDQVLVGDLSATQLGRWYVGTPPEWLEVSFRGGAKSSAPTAARTGFDLLTVAMHEIGHAVGLSTLVALNETDDQDYDVEPTLIGGATMAVKVNSPLDTPHLGAFDSLMFPTVPSGKRRLPSGTDLLAIASAADWSDIVLPRTLGDMDCDGDLDFDDIASFVLGIQDPDAYEATFGVPVTLKGDMNGDGDLDFDDIPAFATHFGSGISAGRLSVPEPATALLLAAGLGFVSKLGFGCRTTAFRGRRR